MKKIAAMLFLVLVMGIGVLYFFNGKAEHPTAASDFMPDNEGLSNYALVGLNNLGSLIEDLGDGIEFLLSGFDGYIPDNMDLMERLSVKLHDSATGFRDMKLLFSVRANGVIVEPCFWGSVALSSSEPGKFMDLLMDELSAADPGLVIIPYNAELGEKTDPLYQIMDIDTGFTIHTALYRGKPAYLLFSTGEEGLEDMLEAAEDAEVRLEVSRHYQGGDFVHLEVDNRIFQVVLENQGRTVQSGGPFILEAVFFSEGREKVVKLYSNGAELFMTPKELKGLSPISPVEALNGGGKVLGFILARLMGFDKQYFQVLLSGQGAEEAKAAMDYLEQEFDITLQDLVDIFNGEALLVLGGKASSPIGDIPGIYLLMKPIKEGIAEKFASILPRLDIPLKFNPLEVIGWKMVYALDQPITLTLAARQRELMIGVLDAGEILNPSEVPPNISPFLTGRNFGVCAFSVRDMGEVMDDLIGRIQLLHPDPAMDSARQQIGRIIGRVETISCTSISPEESVLRVTMNEEE